jgi:hypothetical protein
VVDPVWIAAFGTLISAVTLSLAIYFRWRDAQSRLKIDYYVGDNPPRDWMDAARIPRKTPADPLVVFWVLNVGARDESLHDAYIAVPGRRDLRVFSGGNPTMPSPPQPGFPRVFGQSLQGVAHALVNEGCTGTARVDLVIRLGRGKLHKKRIEIPGVEARAEGREPA